MRNLKKPKGFDAYSQNKNKDVNEVKMNPINADYEYKLSRNWQKFDNKVNRLALL